MSALPLAILPGWFPTEAALFAVVAFIVAMIFLNAGLWWVVNLLAQDEPLVIAAGVFLITGASWLTVNATVGSQMAWMAAGLVLVAAGIAAQYTDWLDFEDVV